ARRHYRGGDQSLLVHRRHVRSRPAHSHGRRDARQQLLALANLIRRAMGYRQVLAGVWDCSAARGSRRFRPPRAALRRPADTGEWMIRTRLLVGWSLALAVFGILIPDLRLEPSFPILFTCLVLL